MKRRDYSLTTAAGDGTRLALATTAAHAQHGGHAQPASCPADGTPMQFIPKKPADPESRPGRCRQVRQRARTAG